MKDFVSINLDVFQCSCTEKGRQCAAEFTRARAFAPLLKTLERKNPGGVTLEVIAANAICAFHARILAWVRTDVVRMDDVLSKYFELAKKAREEEKEQRRLLAEKQRRRERWLIANTSHFSQKLKAALR